MDLLRRVLVVCAACALCGAAALAAGPVDGEVGAVWWANDFETDTGTSEDGAAPGFRAELWLVDRYGLRAGHYASESDSFGSEAANYTSVDALWRPYSPSENNFVAVGLGWQQMDLEAVGLEGDTSGMRMAVEGRVGLLPMLYAYGEGAYMPSLDDATVVDFPGARLEDLEGYEYELGVSWKLAPFVSMRAGWRAHDVDFHREGFTTPSVGTPTNLGPSGATVGGVMPIEAEWEFTGQAPCQNCDPETTFADSGQAETSGYFLGFGFHF